MKRKNLTAIIFAISIIILLSAYLLLFIVGIEKQAMVFEEDGIIEYASAIFNVITSIMILYLFLKSKWRGESFVTKGRRNYFLMLLGLLFLVVAGEEISWGQRLLNLETPGHLNEINVQHELNLHNINIFDVTGDDGHTAKKGLARMITANRMYSLFWFLYCVILPVISAISQKFQHFLNKLAFPLVPIWISGLFLFNFLIAKVLERISFFRDLYLSVISEEQINGFLFRVTEIKEYGYAFLFLVISTTFTMRFRNSGNQENFLQVADYDKELS